MTAEAFRCAAASEARGEPIFGTASVVRRWLLLEQPGSWGFDALMQSRLPEAVATELRVRAKAAGVRVVLIRRGPNFASEGRQCYFVRTEDCDLYLSHLRLDHIDDLLDVDLNALRDGRPVAEASEHLQPVFLVCTHGRHDACCSIHGNRVARIACTKVGAESWECSHIGGDRFAANLVCFPHGIYYGRVGPSDVGPLIESYQRGVIALDHYRGRSCYPFDVQAAEYFARREAALTGVDDLVLTETSRPGDSGLRAAFANGTRRQVRVHVEVRQSAEPYRLTCAVASERLIPRYELVTCEVTEV